MALNDESRFRSPMIGGLYLPPDHRTDSRYGGADEPASSPTPDEPVTVLIELNLLFPGGLTAVTEAFFEVWANYEAWAEAPAPTEQASGPVPGPPVPAGLERVTAKIYQCVLTRAQLRGLIDWDSPERRQRPPTIFKVWPDYEIYPQIDRSAPTVKADAAWRSYNARGHRIVWAVIDSGIDRTHPHFSTLELAAEDGQPPAASSSAVMTPSLATAGLHRDFTALVKLPGNPPADPPSPLTDELGHGTHVAGILAGACPAGRTPHVASSDEPPKGTGFVSRERTGELSGMAPACELVSLKVLRRNAQGVWVTSSAAVMAALDYLRTEVNVDRSMLRVHGVNISLGCSWDPRHYAAGQSPLSQMVNQLVDTGVVVVVSAGNGGSGQSSDPAGMLAILGSITEPAHAEGCIAVGSTHRDSPHVFGVSWTSGKGPTLDGRDKPDVVAPGEWITSAATGAVRSRAGMDDLPVDDPERLLTYAEQSGTSMAAPHVSGLIAAFLSARPEFIGRPRDVKRLLCENATDIGRQRYAQGAGLVDLMRMLANS